MAGYFPNLTVNQVLGQVLTEAGRIHDYGPKLPGQRLRLVTPLGSGFVSTIAADLLAAMGDEGTGGYTEQPIQVEFPEFPEIKGVDLGPLSDSLRGLSESMERLSGMDNQLDIQVPGISSYSNVFGGDQYISPAAQVLNNLFLQNNMIQNVALNQGAAQKHKMGSPNHIDVNNAITMGSGSLLEWDSTNNRWNGLDAGTVFQVLSVNGIGTLGWRSILELPAGPTTGDILYRGASALAWLNKGNNGEVLTLAGGFPGWVALPVDPDEKVASASGQTPGYLGAVAVGDDWIYIVQSGNSVNWSHKIPYYATYDPRDFGMGGHQMNDICPIIDERGHTAQWIIRDATDHTIVSTYTYSGGT